MTVAHFRAVAQVVPHAPQLIGSFMVRAHVSPHIMALSAHTHAELTHSLAPQSCRSSCGTSSCRRSGRRIEAPGGHTHAEASQSAPRVQAIRLAVHGRSGYRMTR
jgi:hypothetical protein